MTTATRASAVQISSRCASCVPNAGMISRLKTSAPMIGADRVGRIDAADQPRRILAARPRRGERQGKARAPEAGGGQHGDERRAARSIWKLNHGSGGERGIDRPVRETRGSSAAARPRDRDRDAASGTSQQRARPLRVAGQPRARRAADAEADEEHRQQ